MIWKFAFTKTYCNIYLRHCYALTSKFNEAPYNSMNKHTCRHFSASAFVKIKIQDIYSFSFKFHLTIISIGLFHMLCTLKFSTCSLPLRMMRKPFRAILQNISKKKEKCLDLNMLSEVLHSANYCLFNCNDF